MKSNRTVGTMFSISRISVDLNIDTGIDVLSGCMEKISYQKVQEYGKNKVKH